MLPLVGARSPIFPKERQTVPNCDSPAVDQAPLSPRQHQLIAALLTENSVTAAAKLANCARRTAYRWLEQPEFQEAYRAERRKLVDRATSQLQTASTEAVAALRSVLQDVAAPAYSRVAAARFIVDAALRAREFEELEVRIIDLDRRLSEREAADHLREEVE